MLKKCLWLMVAASLCAGAQAETIRPAATQRSPLDSVKLDQSTFVGKAGYWRVGKDVKGNWWFITPENKPFYYRGVTSINDEGTTGGRRAQPGRYTEATSAKYADEKAFATAQIRRLRSWGFNATGAWATREFFDFEVDGTTMPFTEVLEFAYVGPQIRGDGIGLPDVFDPRWQKAGDEYAKNLCTPLRESKGLIGYFTDNELSWAQPSEEDIAAQSDPEKAKLVPPRMWLLQHCLSLPEDAAAFKAAWEFVLTRHGNFAALSKAYGVPIADKNALRKLNPQRNAIVMGDGLKREDPGLPRWDKPPVVIRTAAFMADTEAFSKVFAERYFKLTSEMIRKHDPNHLILGCRFGGPPGSVVLAAHKKEWVDVLSANNYRPNMKERMMAYYTATKLPVLNGEFAYHSGLFHTRGRTAERMAQMGAESLEELFTAPGVVGYTWYRWVQDEPAPGSRGSPISCGLVNTRDEEVKIHTETLTRVNAKADTIAAARTGR